VAGVDGACGWWPVGGSRSDLVGVVGGDPRMAFGGRRRRILSCVHEWASPMWCGVPFAAGTEREVSGSGCRSLD
jgi:hypothetical protein